MQHVHRAVKLRTMLYMLNRIYIKYRPNMMTQCWKLSGHKVKAKIKDIAIVLSCLSQQRFVKTRLSVVFIYLFILFIFLFNIFFFFFLTQWWVVKMWEKAFWRTNKNKNVDHMKNCCKIFSKFVCHPILSFLFFHS